MGSIDSQSVRKNKSEACYLAGLFLLLLAGQTSRILAGPTVTIGQNFTGNTLGVVSQALPPDSNGAIGPTRFMEFVNGVVSVYNRTNGASVQRKSDLKFWADAGLNTSAIAISDPRVIYDPLSQRWFACQVDYDPNATDPTAEANDFLLAVSTSSNPAGTWKAFSIQADPDNGFFADFPTMGVDSNAVYLSGDFYSSGEIPEGSGLVSIPKADLLLAAPTVANMSWFGVQDLATSGEVFQPATCFDGSASGSVLSVGDIGSDSSPHSNIVWFAVQNAGGLTPTLTAPVSLTVLPYQVPDNDIAGVPQLTSLQPDGTTTLLANDARFSAKVYAVNGILYAAHNTLFNGRLAIRWYRIRAADHVLLEQGTIAEADLDLSFPSIAANQYGVVVIGCNGTGSSTYLSSFAYVGEIKNGTTAFGPKTLLMAGVGSYHDANEVLMQLLHDLDPSYDLVNSRWGDYSSISVDPNDPTHFWTIQMFPSAVDPDTGGTWSTQITEIIATTAPQLTIANSGTNVLVTWPSYASNYQLQSNTNLLDPGGWTPITAGVSTNGLTLSALIAKTATATFFRLKL
jgi:hypothetical protein